MSCYPTLKGLSDTHWEVYKIHRSNLGIVVVVYYEDVTKNKLSHPSLSNYERIAQFYLFHMSPLTKLGDF